MEGLRFSPKNPAEEQSNWRIVSDGLVPTVGRPGGQTITGGTASGEDLTLESNPSRDGNITLSLPTQNLSVVDADTAAATELGFIEVSLSTGGTAYIRLYATK